MATRRFVYTHRAVKAKGRKDGRSWRWTFFPFREAKSPQPALDQQDAAQFEVTLKDAAENDINRLATDWAEQDVGLKTRYCKAATELRAAEASFRKEQQEALAAKPIYEQAREAFLAIDSPALSPSWRLFWLVVIGLTELPLNGLIFQIFGAGKYETYLMAAGLAVLVPLLAHWSGAALRKSNKTLTDRLLVGAVPIVLLAILLSIGVLRGEYFAAASEALASLGIHLTPRTATLLFVLINFALFFVAMLVSYEGSHGDKAMYNRCRARLSDASAALAKESGEAEAAGKRLERGTQAFQVAKTEREKQFERRAQEARALKESAEWYCQVYRTANLEARADGRRPACFALPPPRVELPLVFTKEAENIDWTCPELQGGTHES